jgi:formate dehydrogenase-N alpha subunit
MTNHWNDVANSDYIMVIAGNPAENHPAAFGHITKAIEENNAKLIVVDPRFTRSASKAHIYCPIRSGTDVGFIGGMIKYVMDDMAANPASYNMTYVTEYTNAAFLVNPGYQGPPDLDGLFVDYNAEKRTYGKGKWTYQDAASTDADMVPLTWPPPVIASDKPQPKGYAKKDKTLQDPNCVFQILKKHYARYTPEMVNKICGTPVEKFLEVASTFSKSGAAGKAGNIMYAMGATHHTNGAQIIRSYGVLQLLLANVGVAGGGIQAMRGESNVQGSTDQALLSHIIPGYLNVPVHTDVTLQTYIDRSTPKTGDPLSLNWWKNTPQYVRSLLKAWWGSAATADNDFAFHYMPKPKSGKNYTHIALFEAMEKGDETKKEKVKGLMCWGQNPAVGSPNANQTLKALETLEWLVCADLWETETSIFWKRPDVDPATINTEVFLLPASGSYEKEGTVTNSGRWMQWRYKCADAPGEARADLEMLNDLMLKIRKLYEDDAAAPNRDGVLSLTWDYAPYGEHVDPQTVVEEINGRYLTGAKAGQLVNGFANLQADGSTSCGNWVYCGCCVGQESLDAFEKAHLDMWPETRLIGNRAARRYAADVGNGGYDEAAGYKPIGLYSYYAWSWPVNRRIVYNRAAVDLNGQPWDQDHPVLTWVGDTAGTWKGDVPDGGGKAMVYGGHQPFIMRSEGHGCLFAPNLGTREASLADGPLPEHYEPWESPLSANPLSGTMNDPVIKIWRPDEQSTPEKGFSIVASTYRVVEHWQAGQMTRNLPWLVEQMPNMFVELSEELAEEKGITNGDEVRVWNTRGEIGAVAVVTKRLKPFQMNGTTVHQIGLPWHWGYAGLSTGDSANVLTPSVGDPNTTIPEYKAFLCNIRRA